MPRPLGSGKPRGSPPRLAPDQVSPPRLGLAAALLTLALDQGSKLGLLFGYDLPVREPVVLGPFVNLIVVWNRGISYGLFQQHGDLGRWLLTIASLIAAVALFVWMSRTDNRLLATALGLIAGGAIGNAIDRVAYGAVFDFVHVHVGTFSWYVFNIADAAIVAGVVGLIYDSIFADRPKENRI
jgi:signal peptidase II